jgi:hypothetical protein
VVGETAGLLLGITLMARIPRLTRSTPWRWIACGLGVLSAGWYLWSVRENEILGISIPWIGVPFALAVLLLAMAFGLSAARPSWGFIPSMIVGTGAVAYRLLIGGIPEEIGPLWPVFIATVAFLYLWWLGSLLFDLSFVWHLYIRHERVLQRMDEITGGSRRAWRDFDTRSPSVQLAKQALEEIELFQGRVGNSLSKSSVNVIAVNTLVEGTRALAGGFIRHNLVVAGEKDPAWVDAADVDAGLAGADGKALQAKVLEAWNTIIGAFQQNWKPVLDGTDGAPGQLRDKYVFPHGIGWQALAQAAADLIAEHGDAWTEIFEPAVTTINWERSNPKFEGRAVIKDPIRGTFRVNNTGPGVKSLKDFVLDKAKAKAKDVAEPTTL